MKLNFAILLLVFSPAFICAQQTSGAGELTVRVRTSEGPVEGAVIALSGRSAGQKLNVTDAEGVCDFRGLRPGAYSLQVIQRSYFPTDETKSRMDHVEIQNGQAKVVTLHLVKGAVLKGKVLSVDGSPIIGMPVSALILADKKTSLPSSQESNGTALSDDRGEFRLYGLRPGSYTVAVNAQRNLSPLKSFTTLFYPREKDSVNAAAFELVAGQEMSLPDMVLDLAVTNQNLLTGLVRGAQGEALIGASLSLTSKDGSQLADSTSSDYEGKFVFEGVPSGDYVLKANFNSQGYFSLQREISVRDSATNNVTLELKSYPLIDGLASLRSKNGVQLLPNFRLGLAPAKTGKAVIELVTDKEGRFSHRTANTGSFGWTFPELPADYFVSRILVAGNDLTHRPLKLEPAIDLREISVELSTGAAQVRGTLPRGTCKSNSVYAVALHATRDEILFARKAECSGDSFSVQSLSPGRYYLVGWPRSDGESNPETIEQAVQKLKVQRIEAITLGRDQLHDNARVLMIGPSRN